MESGFAGSRGGAQKHRVFAVESGQDGIILNIGNIFYCLLLMPEERLFIVYCKIMLNTPQAPDRFNPKVSEQTCGIIQKLYETKHIETMTFGKSVLGHFSKIEPKTSK